MKRIKWLSLGAVALIAAGFLSASNHAQAGTHISVVFGGGGGYCAPAYRPYCPPPVCYAPQPYCPPPRPYFVQPVCYQPAYYPAPRVYYSAPAYQPRAVNYGGYYSRAAYYGPGYR